VTPAGVLAENRSICGCAARLARRNGMAARAALPSEPAMPRSCST